VPDSTQKNPAICQVSAVADNPFDMQIDSSIFPGVRRQFPGLLQTGFSGSAAIDQYMNRRPKRSDSFPIVVRPYGFPPITIPVCGPLERRDDREDEVPAAPLLPRLGGRINEAPALSIVIHSGLIQMRPE